MSAACQVWPFPSQRAGSVLTSIQILRPALNLETLTAIEKTKQELENDGQKTSTIYTATKHLKSLAENTDIFDTEQVKQYIAHAKVRNPNTLQLTEKNWCDPYKNKIINIYAVFCEINGIQFTKPKSYKQKSPIPLIPKAKDVEAIISNSSKNMSTIFQIMTETATEEHELEMTPRQQINAQEGKISIIGTKQHDNGTYKLKEQTAEMLRQYLARNTQEYPFPTAKSMRTSWCKARTKTATKLCNPEIKKILLKNLRNYAGAVFYLTMGKDPIQTMYFMRHKKLETTMNYLRGLTEFSANTEYISKVATTAEEAIELLNQGFKEQSIFNEKHIYTKLKY
jgi:integrase